MVTEHRDDNEEDDVDRTVDNNEDIHNMDKPLDEDEEIQKDLTCPLCSEILRKPKLLTCMHTFCESCVKPLIAYCTGELTCPLCRHVTKTLGNASDLSTNFIAQNIIDAYQIMHLRSEGELRCNECEQDEAEMFCCDCYQRLCRVCSEHHKRSLKFKNHSLLEFDQVTREHMLQGKVKSCDEHSEILKFYCRECEHTVCKDCTVSTKHSGHEFSLLDEIATDNKQYLKKLVNKATRKRKAVIKSITEAENILQNLGDVKNHSIFLIEDTFGKINDLLTKKKKTLIDKINTRFDEGSKSIDKARENSRVLDEWVNFTNTIIDSRCNAEIMDSFVNLRRQLDDISTMEYMKSKPANGNRENDEDKQKKDMVTPNPNAKSRPRVSSVQQILGIESPGEEPGIPYETHSRAYSRSSSISSQLSLTDIDSAKLTKTEVRKNKAPPRPPPPTTSRPSSPTTDQNSSQSISRPTTPTSKHDNESWSNEQVQNVGRETSKPLVLKKAFMNKRRFNFGDILNKSKDGQRSSAKRKEKDDNRPRSLSARLRRKSTSNETYIASTNQSKPKTEKKIFTRSKSLFNISVPPQNTNDTTAVKKPTAPPPPPPSNAASPIYDGQVLARSKSLHNLSLSPNDIKKPTASPPHPPNQRNNQSAFSIPPTLDYITFPEPPSRAPSETSSMYGSVSLSQPLQRNRLRSSLFYTSSDDLEKHIDSRSSESYQPSESRQPSENRQPNESRQPSESQQQMYHVSVEHSLPSLTAPLKGAVNESNDYRDEIIGSPQAENNEFSNDITTNGEEIHPNNNQEFYKRDIEQNNEENPTKQHTTAPQAPPRFFAGITMYRQEIIINESILNMLLEVINDSCLVPLEENTSNVQSEPIFTVQEELFKQ